MSWLSENIGTIIIAAIVFGAAAMILVQTIKKRGKSTCGCNCASCKGCHKS